MKTKFTTYQMALTAVMAAVLCVLGPVSLPIGPVPLSLTVFVVLLSVVLLGTRLGAASYLVYLALGAVGLPVFSGYAGGLAKLAGPTGGYLVGFLPMAIIAGAFLRRGGGKPAAAVLGMALGVLVDYALGTAWFVWLMGCGVWYALSVCVFPFVVGDAVKIVLAVALGTLLRERLIRAGVLRQAALDPPKRGQL